jgi:hypothetical protein
LDETGGETATDVVNGNHGVWKNPGANLSWTPGQIGNAADVNDADNGGNYFTIDSIPQLVGGAGWTISAWINPDDQTDGYNGIFMSRTTNGAGSWGLALEGSGPYHTDNRMNAGGGLDSPNSIEVDGSWYHVANTWDATTGVRRAFINGALVASSPADAANGNVGPITDSGTWFIGFDNCCGGGRDFGGSIDDLALYSIPLSPATVKTIYAGGLAGKSVTEVMIPEPACLALISLACSIGLMATCSRPRRGL